MKRARILLSGKVQGVFYRDFARKEAEKLGITGFVRNLRDGRVEVVGEGHEDKLRLFINECRRGPFLAFVKSAEVTMEEATGKFRNFEIRL